MVHIKKIALTVLLVIMGFGIYNYWPSDKKGYLKNHRGKDKEMATNVQESKKEITTPSGLSYTILQEAPQGAQKPGKGQLITVHYTGFLDKDNPSGSTFDSSVKRGQPFQFVVGVGMVIKGWDEALLDMSVGEKRRLVIPANLGYGSRGVSGVIPPNATLFFDVELLAV